MYDRSNHEIADLRQTHGKALRRLQRAPVAECFATATNICPLSSPWHLNGAAAQWLATCFATLVGVARPARRAQRGYGALPRRGEGHLKLAPVDGHPRGRRPLDHHRASKASSGILR
jgi:hypothetical protein